MSVRLGFIGFGNIAQAMVKGFIKSGMNPDDIFVCSAHYDKCKENADKFQVIACRRASDVIESAEIIVLAVKPYQLQEVVEENCFDLNDKIVVSVAAGITYDDLSSWLLEGTACICTCPNTPVSTTQGILVCEEKHSLDELQYACFKEVFEKIAMIETVDTQHMSIAGTIAGCTPAYAAMFMEALADGAVKHGLKREVAYRLVSQMMAGTGKMANEENLHPGILKDAVCSPGGTTIKGVASLEESGFRGAIIKAIDAVEGK